MQTHTIQLSDVIYNAANQSFEALVTVHNDDGSRRYACAIDAPIDMSFEDAAKGLKTQAMRRHAGRGGLFSQTLTRSPALRAGRAKFDPVRWLHGLLDGSSQRAA